MNCYSCIHLDGGADSMRRCQGAKDAPRVSRDLEAACEVYVREPGSDDEVPSWYWGKAIPGDKGDRR